MSKTNNEQITGEPENMGIRSVRIELTEKMPLIMHADNIDWSDLMEEWRTDAANKKKSKAGDDRTPPYTWHGCLYYDDPENGKVAMPTENIMRCIMDGAAQVPTGKGRGTFKSQSQSGIIPGSSHWEFFIHGRPILMKDIQKTRSLKTFKEHVNTALDLGFSLFPKRVRIGKAKHVRVRPIFRRWSVIGELLIIDEAISNKVLQDILDIAGRLKGLGDWRPSAPQSPGPFGTFTAKIL